MQVFIIGSAIETAMCLDKKRLNKQRKRFATEYHNNDFDCDDEFMSIDNRLFPEVTFENSPRQVEIKLV